MSPSAQKQVVAELVWDANRTGTALNECGCSMGVGHPADWTPEHLLAVAASSCLMSTFFKFAAGEGLDVLGYVSTSRLEVLPEGDAPLRLVVMPCIVVASDADGRAARALLEEAFRRSPVNGALAPHVTIEPEIRVIAAAEAPSTSE